MVGFANTEMQEEMSRFAWWKVHSRWK